MGDDRAGAERPRTFGDYELLEQIGTGGMATVFRALGPGGREVALKLSPVPTSPDDPRAERFRREGWITADLRHPHIVPIHDAGVVDGRPYLAFTMVEAARTLADVLPSWPLRRRVAAIRDVARALAHAHQAGVVHRDVKPDNVLVTPDDRVLLADFGVAAAEDMERMTRSQALVGTPLYMAPEVTAPGGARGSPSADVYALGVVLYEALTGEHPYAARGLPALFDSDLRRCPPASAKNPEVPAALSQLCEHAMQTDPTRRYPDAETLANDLDAWLEGKPTTFAPPGTHLARWRVPTLGGALLVGALLTGALLAARDARPDEAAPALTPSAEPAAAAAAGSERDRRRALELRCLEALRAGALDDDALRAQLGELAELPATPEDEPSGLGDALAPRFLSAFAQDMREGLELLEALARAGLRLRDRRLGDTVVDSLFSARIFNALPGRSYWRGLAAAACLDAPVRREHCLQQAGLHDEDRPAFTDPWLEYVDLIRLSMQGRLRQIDDELRALLEDPAPLVVLGPHNRAVVAMTLAGSKVPDVQSLLEQAQRWSPNDPIVWHMSGKILTAPGLLDQALSANQRGLDLYEQERFVELYSLANERANMLRQRLRIQVEQGDDPGALASYQALQAVSVDLAAQAVAEDLGVAEVAARSAAGE